MKWGNVLPISLVIQTLLQSLSGCSSGDSPCSESNRCVAGYACNKDGECIPASDFQIITDALDSAYVGEPYEMQLQASGGIPPHQWSIDSSLSWLSVENKSGDLWVLTGTPGTSTEGTEVVIIATDNSFGDGEERRKTLSLVVFECVNSRKRNCYTPQGGVCVSGYETCTNNTWGACDESMGPSIDIENCGPTCEPCDVNTSDSCRGGVCACGDGSPCTGGLICCHHKCMDVPECGDCGDEVKQDWEACEGNDFGQTTCESLGYAFGDLACTDRCIIDTSDCCGDGAKGVSEQCDDENTDPVDGCMECEISDFSISTPSPTGNALSSIAIDPEGGFVAVWQTLNQTGSGIDILARRFDTNGKPIGNQSPVNTHTDDNQISPSIGMDSTGAFVVVWVSYEQDGSGGGVYGQLYDNTGNTVGNEFQVNTRSDGHQGEASSAMSSSGNFVATWVGPDDTDMYDYIYFQLFDSAGNEIGSNLIANVTASRNHNLPSASMDSMQNLVIVWERANEPGPGSSIIGRRFLSDGTPQGDEFQISSTSQASNTEPEVAMNSAGAFVVSWQRAEGDGSGDGVLARLYSASGNALTDEFQVNTNTDSDQSLPDAVMDDEGGFIIVWSSRGQDNGNDGIYGQRYDQSGQPIGDEFQINTPRYQSAVGVSAAMNALGNLVVSWDSFDPTVVPELYGQRFNSQGQARGREPW